MEFSFANALSALSLALDAVENDLLGVTTHHSERVAYICIKLGRALNLNDFELLDLACVSLLHDNALTEYIKSEENIKSTENSSVKMHCIYGERNVSKITFYGDVENAVKYHHENANGSGPFGLKTNEVSLYARLIHLADSLDARFDLSNIDEDKYYVLMDYVKKYTNILYDEEVANYFINGFKLEDLIIIENDQINILLEQALPVIKTNYSNQSLIDFASIFASIIDYKSPFTKNHSIGIAQKIRNMAIYYKMDEEWQAKLYFAGALHDIGKLIVERDILEKPDKLSESEYKHIQTHAYASYSILNSIKGFEEIRDIASFHHEYLDGTGYPFGKKANELTKLERLMTCLDIYQALSEKRPYKDGMSHKAVMNVLNDMAKRGKIDFEIIKDIDNVYGNMQSDTL